jgi:hypothetical protein
MIFANKKLKIKSHYDRSNQSEYLSFLKTEYERDDKNVNVKRLKSCIDFNLFAFVVVVVVVTS